MFAQGPFFLICTIEIIATKSTSQVNNINLMQIDENHRL